MSTKTLRKRIALATVAALGAGVLSLVSTSSANATIGAGDLAASNCTAGSVGLLYTSTDICTTGSVAKTATILSTGSLVLTTHTAAAYFTVTAGSYVSGTSNTDKSKIDQGQMAVTTASGDSFTVTPTGAAGSTFQVNGYTSSAKTTLVSVVTVTIAGTSVYGVPSAAKTTAYWVASDVTATSDASGASAAIPTNPLYLAVAIKDAYGNAVAPSASNIITATVSSGANVGIASQGSAASGSWTTAVATSGNANETVKITEATTGAGWSGTVTISYNGTVLATRTATIQGYVSKLVIAPVAVAKSATSTASVLSYNAYDAAGNVDTASTVSISSSSNPAVIAASGSVAVGTTNNATSSGELGYLTVTALAAGKSDVVVSYTRPDGTVVKSNSVTVNVAGGADTYKAALDKSKYAPGDVATLTLTFSDSKGNPAASSVTTYATAGTSPSLTWNATFSTPQLTQVGTLGQFGSSFVNTYGTTGNIATDQNGQIKIKYTVGTTEGSYNAIVDFPTVDAQDGAAQTVAYSISSGGTSLNDVLKGIVSLIASINKQIAALAKLVTKKK